MPSIVPSARADRTLRRRSLLGGLLLAGTMVVSAVVGGTLAAAIGLLGLVLVGVGIVWPAVRAAEWALAAERAAQVLLVARGEETSVQHRLLLEQAEVLAAHQEELEAQRTRLAETAHELEAQNVTLLDQRDRLRLQAETLARAEAFTASVLDSATDGIVAFDADRRFTAWNATMAALYGRPDVEVLGRTLDEAFPELAAELGPTYDAAIAGETRTLAGRAIRHAATGVTVLVDATYGPLRARDGTVILGGVGVLHDVTVARRQAAELERLSTVVRQTDDGVVMTDARGRLTWVNAAWERMTGWTLAEVVGLTPGAFLQGAGTDPETVAALREAVRATRGHAGEVLNYRRDGTPFWSSLTTTPIRDADGVLTGWVGIKRDITARKAHESQLRAWSVRDPLTGLLNRRGFDEAAVAVLREAGARSTPGLLLYGDLNDFKAINDTFGHEAGDAALADMAAVLREALGAEAVVARFGGDEFTALLPGVAHVGAVTDRLTRALVTRNGADTSRAPLSMSFGAVPWTRWLVGHPDGAPGVLLAQLLQAADRALYAAKARKRADHQRVRERGTSGGRTGEVGGALHPERPLLPLWIDCVGLADEDTIGADSRMGVGAAA